MVEINGKVIDNPLGMTTAFNDFFINVGPNTEKAVPKTPEKYLKDRKQLIAHISTEEVTDIIKAL